MTLYAYGQGKLSLRPVIATEEYDDRALCGRLIRGYRGAPAKKCGRRRHEGGTCRPEEYVITWGDWTWRSSVTRGGRCRACGYLPGSPGCRMTCGSGS